MKHIKKLTEIKFHLMIKMSFKKLLKYYKFMLYNLFEYLNQTYDFPGAGLFKYISFRAAMAVITSLIVSLVFGGKIINYIKRKQIGERVRILGLSGEEEKKELQLWED